VQISRKREALVKYCDEVDYDILNSYHDADEYIWINVDDPDLHPVKIKLPECPDFKEIAGFGKKAEDQIFERESLPFSLEYLINKTRNDVRRNKDYKTIPQQYRAFYETVWETIETNRQHEDNLEWLDQQWNYRIYGKWVFINGKPTYLCGWHWFYLNYWKIENVGLPVYWDRDMKWFNAVWYFYNDTTIPLQKGGKLQYNDDGSLKLKDVGYLTILGTNVLKGRRVGDSTKMSCINFCVISMMKEGKGGIQGDTEETASKIFKEKLMFAYNKLPFFWKPEQIQMNPKSELHFCSNDPAKGLDSVIDFATTSGKTFYDSRKLHIYQGEEPGKVLREDVHARHSVVKRCLKTGSERVGFALYASTVDDMLLKSGKQFEELSKSSHFERRGNDGFTLTGMVNIFFPAWEGYEGFIGKYGESIIDPPTEEQMPYVKTKIFDEDSVCLGSKGYLKAERSKYLKIKDFKELSHQKRLHPFTFAECFTPSFENQFFNMDIVEKRTIELKRDVGAKIQGDFVWVSGQDSYVDFVPSSQGKFFISHDPLSRGQANKKFQHMGLWMPGNSRTYVASADAFRLEKTEGGKMSNGAGCVRWKRDPQIDDDSKDIKDWVTARDVCTYSYRPPTIDEYCEDMLKMCHYYGCSMYPEMNVPHVAQYFIRRGYRGYLHYDTDPETGKPKENPGFHSGGALKQKLFNLMADDIQNHGMRCRHLEILEEIASIRGLDDMTNWDLFTAKGGTLLAEESQYSQYLSQMQYGGDTFDIGGFM
jgi:hypothetical protein